MGLVMRNILNAPVLSGLFLVSVSHFAFGADMDRVVFADPPIVQPGPQDTGDTYSQETLTGFAEGSFAYGRGKIAGGSDDGTRWALRGSVNAALDTNWNVEIDGLYNRMSVDPVDVDTFAGAAHAYYRATDAFAVGGFVQAQRFSSSILDVLAPLGLDNYATDVVGGGEAAIYTDPATFYGQVGFGRTSYSGLGVDHLLAKLGTRVYANDNLRFDFEGTLNRFSGYGGHADLYSFSAIGNYRFSQMPLTAFAGYQYDQAKAPELTSEKLNVNTFVTGLRFSFGSNSLKEEERKGPAWSISPVNL